MPKKAHIFGWSVVAIGAVTALCAALTGDSADPASLLVCGILAALASTFKVKLPGLTGSISPGFVFVLVAAGRFSFGETLLVGGVAALVQSVWRAKTRPRFLQAAFNAATLVIAGGLAHGVANGLMAGRNKLPGLVSLAVSGVVLLVTNSMIVAIMLCLIQDAPLQKAWQAIQLWAVPYYLAGGMLAAVWVQIPLGSLSIGVLAAVSVYLLSVCYRGLAASLGSDGRFPVASV